MQALRSGLVKHDEGGDAYQEFCQTLIFSPFLSGSSTVMSNILLKFCPRALKGHVSRASPNVTYKGTLLRSGTLDSTSVRGNVTLAS